MRISVIALAKRLGEVISCARLTSNWLPLSLAYLKLTSLPYPHRVHLRTGESLTLRESTDLVIFWLIFVRRHYPVQPSDQTIVDVGANIGIFTLYAARTAPAAHIIAVEPFPETLKRLEETVETNHLEGRVTIIPCAITGSEGTVFMDDSVGVPSQYRSILTGVPQMLNRNHKGNALPGVGESVPTLTLSELLSTGNLEHVDLLKANIHGNEYEVLLGSPDSALSHFDRVAVQYHEVPKELGVGKMDLFRRMEDVGFHLVADADTRHGAGRAIFTLRPPQPARRAATA